MFKVRLSDAIYHNHRLDSSYDGRYIVRLPDRTQVYAEDYASRLAELERQQEVKSTGVRTTIGKETSDDRTDAKPSHDNHPSHP